MTLIGRTRHEEVNGETTRDSGWLLSVKGIRHFRGWCLWHHSNEAGMRVIQVGPVVLEIWG